MLSGRAFLLCNDCGAAWQAREKPAVCPLCRSRGGVQAFTFREDRSAAQFARWRRRTGRPTHA